MTDINDTPQTTDERLSIVRDALAQDAANMRAEIIALTKRIDALDRDSQCAADIISMMSEQIRKLKNRSKHIKLRVR